MFNVQRLLMLLFVGTVHPRAFKIIIRLVRRHWAASEALRPRLVGIVATISLKLFSYLLLQYHYFSSIW